MVEIAQRYDLDRRYTAKTSGWQALKEFERSEHEAWPLNAIPLGPYLDQGR